MRRKDLKIENLENGGGFLVWENLGVEYKGDSLPYCGFETHLLY